MAWKGRKMFSSAIDMQSGGTVPYPSYRGGGAVGATPVERKKMFSIWDKMTKGQKENVMDGRRYQMGGKVMPSQLFEQGDQDINMALNTMASMTNPSVEDINKMETKPMGMGMGMGKMSKDQGPMNFEKDLMGLKQDYKNEIFSFVEKPGAVEKLGPFLKTMQLSYQNDLTDMMKRHGVKEYSPEQELFTPEFMEEVKVAFDSGGIQEMQDGGLALPTTQEQLDAVFSAFPGKYTLEEFNMLPKTTRQMLVTRALIEKGTKAPVSAGQSPLDAVYKEGIDGAGPTTVRQRLNQIIEERKKLARQSAVMPQTKQGGILGFASQMNAYRANQAEAESQALGDEINLLKSLSTGSRAGLGKDTAMPMDLITAMTKPEVQETRKFNDIMKTAKTTAEALQLEPTVFVQHAIVKDDSPMAFTRELPQYSGERVYGGLAYNIDDFIAKKHEEFETDMSLPYSKYENTAKALREWIALDKL